MPLLSQRTGSRTQGEVAGETWGGGRHATPLNRKGAYNGVPSWVHMSGLSRQWTRAGQLILFFSLPLFCCGHCSWCPQSVLAKNHGPATLLLPHLCGFEEAISTAPAHIDTFICLNVYAVLLRSNVADSALIMRKKFRAFEKLLRCTSYLTSEKYTLIIS
jgi:hypothetical protein